MSQPSDLDALLDYPGSADLEAPRHGFQGDRGKLPGVRQAPLALTIAISREAGARGSSIARRLGQQLGWQVYDQELLEYMSQDATIRLGLVENLPTACLEWIETHLHNLGRTCDLSRQDGVLYLAQSVMALGAQGESVLVGRGAGCILPSETTLHVRIVAPLADRIAYMAQWMRLTTAESTQRVAASDERRANFLRTHFGRAPGEIHQYDMILNSSILGEEICAELISQAARLRWQAGVTGV